ncbi:endonuclease/exonuclease/phosphatase family protein [Ferruginibacter sp.]
MSPRLKKFARISFISINCISILFYLMACLVPFFNAGSHWFIALLGLGFPILFFVLLLFLIYWIIRRSRWAWICVAALLLGWQQWTATFSFHTQKTFHYNKEPGSLRVLTWNISSWGESNASDNQNNLDVMVNLIKSSQADVLCFQEYLYYKKKAYRDTVIPALKDAGYQYVYFAKINYSGRLYTTSVLTGTEIMSKYPILNAGYFYYSEKDFIEPLIYADLQINNQVIRVFTTHLQSVSFKGSDYDAIYSLKDPAEASVTGSKAIISKLKYAYSKRAVQADILHEKIKASPYPVIVCGDFNDVPNSYTYFTVKGNLQDAFLKKGSGMGRTLRFISPTLRIDYIMADKKFAIKQYTTFKVPYSDHYPVVADIDLSGK